MPNARSMVYFNKQYLRSCDVPGFPPFDIPFPKDHVNFPRTISYIFFTLTTVYIMQQFLDPDVFCLRQELVTMALPKSLAIFTIVLHNFTFSLAACGPEERGMIACHLNSFALG